MRTQKRIQFWVFAIALGLGTFGCIPDRVSWSGDGKRLNYVCVSDGAAWSWDVAAKKPAKIFSDPKNPAVFCYAAGDSLFVATEYHVKDKDGNEKAIHDLHCVAADGKVFRDVAKNVCIEGGMTASADGKRAFFTINDEAAEQWEFWEVDLSGGVPKTRRVVRQGDYQVYPCASADGKRILVTCPGTIGILDPDTGKTATLIKATGEIPALYGVWVLNETAVAYLETYPKKDDPNSASSIGNLCVFNPADGSTRKLAGGIPILRRPAVDRAGKTAYVVQALSSMNGERLEMDKVQMKDFQIAAFDLKSGERRQLTSEPDGAFWPAPNPAGDKVAFYLALSGTRGDRPEDLVLRLCDAQGGKTEAIPCQ